MIPLPAPKDLIGQNTPLPHKKLAQEIAANKSQKKAIITGPCSIHNYDTAIEYAKRIAALAPQVPNCLLVMRVYVEKPRTRSGWKGFLYAPDPQSPPNLAEGLQKTRSLFSSITEMGVPIATEFVDPISAYYLSDLVTWGFIGARTSHSQPHRQIASLLDIPVGFKNCTTGSLVGAINGLHAARHPQTFFGLNNDGKCAQIDSPGNPYTHLVLRGSNAGPNYHEETNCPVLIDCSHGNSSRCHFKQQDTAYQILAENRPDLLGIMLESHLKAGKQEWPDCPSTSITDPCIDWETTEQIIRDYSSLITENQRACSHPSTTSPATV
jgi:3-deoxy-7-phosphoheptulonate synthase